MTLQNKRVVVIGGTSGIGLAVSKAFVEAGSHVFVASRSTDKVEMAKSIIGSDVEGYVVDFREEAALEEFFQSVGPFHHLVVTAGDGVMGPFHSLPVTAARTAFDSKFWGQYVTARAALPFIDASGSITLTSGVYGTRPPKGAATLAAINSAVEGLTRGLACDLAPIRVNVVSPGLVDTPIYSGMDDEARQGMFKAVASQLLVQHIAKPEEIAQAYVYLASNTFTTGTTLSIEGGALLS